MGTVGYKAWKIFTPLMGGVSHIDANTGVTVMSRATCHIFMNSVMPAAANTAAPVKIEQEV